MNRKTFLILGLMWVAAQPSFAGSFDRVPIAPELGLDRLDRNVARERAGRDLFANPYATVTLSHVDIYDKFPYVESRHFQVVSDSRWNRLIFGERGKSLAAYDGKSGALGALAEPRGLAVDENDRVYVADTRNDRIVVLQASTEFETMSLVPLFAIEGLSRPYDVAYSDGGTPFHPGDDLLYVADTGKNRVVAMTLQPAGARVVAVLGELGSGPGHFAGPMAIAVGRDAAGSTRDVYVADAHSRRIAHLRHDPAGLRWMSEAHHDADVVTSLDTDEWGNVYAAAPHQGSVRKFNAQLAPVAELHTDLTSPKGFHIPFVNVRDHRNGTVVRAGQPNALSVDGWASGGGIAMWKLGAEVNDLRVTTEGAPAAHFTLTDRARVTLEITDAASGRSLTRREIGTLDAGPHQLGLEARNEMSNAGADLVLTMSAASSYPGGSTQDVRVRFPNAGAAAQVATRPMLIGNSPNPARASTRIAFVLPPGQGERVRLQVFDALGRRVRSFDRGFLPGWNEVVWDGTDDRGHVVQAGVYVSRLDVGEAHFTHRMVMVR